MHEITHSYLQVNTLLFFLISIFLPHAFAGNSDSECDKVSCHSSEFYPSDLEQEDAMLIPDPIPKPVIFVGPKGPSLDRTDIEYQLGDLRDDQVLVNLWDNKFINGEDEQKLLEACTIDSQKVLDTLLPVGPEPRNNHSVLDIFIKEGATVHANPGCSSNLSSVIRILQRTEEEARTIVQYLITGESFNQLPKEHIQDLIQISPLLLIKRGKLVGCVFPDFTFELTSFNINFNPELAKAIAWYWDVEGKSHAPQRDEEVTAKIERHYNIKSSFLFGMCCNRAINPLHKDIFPHICLPYFRKSVAEFTDTPKKIHDILRLNDANLRRIVNLFGRSMFGRTIYRHRKHVQNIVLTKTGAQTFLEILMYNAEERNLDIKIIRRARDARQIGRAVEEVISYSFLTQILSRRIEVVIKEPGHNTEPISICISKPDEIPMVLDRLD